MANCSVFHCLRYKGHAWVLTFAKHLALTVETSGADLTAQIQMDQHD